VWWRRSRTATKDQPLLSSDARAHRRSFVANKISRHIDTNRSTVKYVDSDRVCTRSLLQLSWRSVTAAAFLDRFSLCIITCVDRLEPWKDRHHSPTCKLLSLRHLQNHTSSTRSAPLIADTIHLQHGDGHHQVCWQEIWTVASHKRIQF